MTVRSSWRWTPEIIQACALMWANDKSYLDIAKEYGITRNMVSGMVSRNKDLFPTKEGIKKRGSFIQTLDITKAGKLWKEGKSCEEIASEMGITTNAVQLLARRNRSLMPSRRPSSPEKTKKEKKAKTVSDTGRVHQQFHGTKQATYADPELDSFERSRLPGYSLVENNGCMYPLTESSPHMFCGCNRVELGRYCEYHAEKCSGGIAGESRWYKKLVKGVG